MLEVGKQWYGESNEFIPLAVEWLLDERFALNQSNWRDTNMELLASAVLLEFVHFLCLFGTAGDIKTSFWRPQRFLLGSEPVLTFIPTAGDVHLAIPEAVKDPECHLLRRCWVLEEKYQDCEANEWILLGKSPLFGRYALNKQLERFQAVRMQQRVFGRKS
jgi:hypothetical protein